jgi:predicted Fe-S protein YdhL (DUF1289 family)
MRIVESPCVRNCCLNEEDICLGCFRVLTEITQWTLVDEKTRREFLDNANSRRLQATIKSEVKNG